MTYIDFETNKPYFVDVICGYTAWLKENVSEGRPKWRYRMIDRRFYPRGIYFRHGEDALAFKLRFML